MLHMHVSMGFMQAVVACEGLLINVIGLLSVFFTQAQKWQLTRYC